MPDSCYLGYSAPWLDSTMAVVSLIGDSLIPVAITATVALIFWIFKYRKFAAILVASSLVGNVVKDVLKYLIAKPRPITMGCRAIVFPGEFSMPSGHTIFYTIFFGLLAYFFIRIMKKKWYSVILAGSALAMIIMGGFSRVYLGAHFVSDVLVGYLIGAIILASSIYFLEKKSENR
jgi:membrane-associated phospholipid phosphatase